MKKRIIIPFIIIILVIISILLLFILLPSKIKNNDNEDILQNNTNYVFDGKFSNVLITNGKTAKQSLEDIKENLGIDNIDNDLVLISNNSDGEHNFYRFNQYYNDIKVYGNEILLGTYNNAADYITSSTEYITEDKVENNFKYKLKDAYNKIIELINDEELTSDENFSIDGEKILYKVDNKFTNAYEINVTNYSYLYDYTFLLDNDLNIIKKTNNLKYFNTKITAENKYDEKVSLNVYEKDDLYELVDRKRNIRYYKYEETDINNVLRDKYRYSNYLYKFEKNPDKYIVTAADYINRAYDFYDKLLNYKGMDNNGGTILVFLGAKKNNKNDDNVRENNACFTRNYGDSLLLITNGYRNDDSEVLSTPIVLAHEYTHGVLNHIAIITNRGIEEGYADIMGVLANSYHNGRLDFNYSRSPANQDNSEQFYSLKDINQEDADEHQYATILSRAFYLMTTGLNKIENIEKLSKLWFGSMYYLPTSADFTDVLNAVLKSAKNLHFSDDEINKIIDSFRQVGIYKSLVFNEEETSQCANSRCEIIRNRGEIKFLNLDGKIVKADRVTVYKVDPQEKIYESYDKKSSYVVNINEPNGLYRIEAEYNGVVDELYFLVCDASNDSQRKQCLRNINFYFKVTKTNDNNKDTSSQLSCDIDMSNMIGNFFSNKEIAKMVKSLTANITVDYETETISTGASLSMYFVIDLSLIDTSRISNYVNETLFMEQLKKELEKGICINNKYDSCNVSYEKNSFIVTARGDVHDLINYKSKDISKDKMIPFIENRGFTCEK